MRPWKSKPAKKAPTADVDELRPAPRRRIDPSETRWRNAAAYASVAAIFVTVWYAIHALLILFAGVLFGQLLGAATDRVSRRTHLSRPYSLALVLTTLVALSVAAGWFFTTGVASQLDALIQEIPRSVEQLEGRLRTTSWGRMLLRQSPLDGGDGMGNALWGALGVVSSTFTAVSALVVVLFVGTYLAATPGRYAEGLLDLLPESRRDRGREVFSTLAHTLRLWLAARLVSMAVIGVSTTIGYWLIGLDLVLALGLFAAIMNFVPYLGPIIGFAPAFLLALNDGGSVLHVLILYTAIQTVESYVITPLVEQRTVWLPPLLSISSQVVLGSLLGVLGFILASPLAVTGLVLVKLLWVEDRLGEEPHVA